MKNLRYGVCRPALLEDAVALAAECVGGIAVGKRKIIGRKKMLVVLVVGSSRRCKPLIEKAQSAAGDVRDHAVEHAAPLLIGIEAFPQKVAQAAAALRGAERKRPIDQRLSI